MKTEDHAVAAGHSVDRARRQESFEGLMQRIAGRFARVEPRRRVQELVLGLLSDLPRRNCWTIAGHIGDTTPDGLQHLLGRAEWDADLVRDDLRGYVLEHLADEQAVLVVDETGDLKEGTHTVGVQRQYTDTAGRIEDAQVLHLLARTRGYRPSPVPAQVLDRRRRTSRAVLDAPVGYRRLHAEIPDEAADAIGDELVTCSSVTRRLKGQHKGLARALS
ncbi:transposase [Streptomyces flaveolus]|uniref:transposase n=1 Tax=Streptomyces flaveolus TaxID=67297 RepID=UPI00331E5A79